MCLHTVLQNEYDYPDFHYENIPMPYSSIVHGYKNDNFQMKHCDTFLIFAQNIDRWYTSVRRI